jgi:hypothetical protein
MGYDEWVALNSVRISFTAGGDAAAEVAALARVVREVVARVAPQRA